MHQPLEIIVETAGNGFLLATNLADAAAAAACVAIPLLLLLAMRLMPGLRPYWALVALAGVFIVASGLEHAVAIAASRTTSLRLIAAEVRMAEALLACVLALVLAVLVPTWAMSRSKEAAPLTEEERFRGFLDDIGVPAVVVDPEGRIVEFSRHAELLWGHPRTCVIGHDLSMLLPPRVVDAHKVHLERYFRAPVVRPMARGRRVHARRADGTQLALDVSLSPIVRSSGVVTLALIGRAEEEPSPDA